MSMFGTGINRAIDVINQDDDSCKSLIHKVYSSPQSLADALRQSKDHPHLRFKTGAAVAEVRLPENNIIFKKSPNQSPNIYTKPILENQAYPCGEQSSLNTTESIGYKMTNNPSIKVRHRPFNQKEGDHHSSRSEVPASEGGRTKEGDHPSLSRKSVAEENGISIHQQKQYQQIANVPDMGDHTRLNTFYNIHPSEHKRMLDS